MPQRQETSRVALRIGRGGGLSSGPDAALQRTLELEGTLTATPFPSPLYR